MPPSDSVIMPSRADVHWLKSDGAAPAARVPPTVLAGYPIIAAAALMASRMRP